MTERWLVEVNRGDGHWINLDAVFDAGSAVRNLTGVKLAAGQSVRVTREHVDDRVEESVEQVSEGDSVAIFNPNAKVKIAGMTSDGLSPEARRQKAMRGV